jgi:hypothetical protein
MKKWAFADTRNDLIKMVKKYAKAGTAERMAMNIVDCCVVHAWDYLRKEWGKKINNLQDPYPKDVFSTLTKDEVKKCVEAIARVGITPDRFSAYLMRISRENAIMDIKKILVET